MNVSDPIVKLLDAALNMILEGYGHRALDLLDLFITRFMPALPKVHWDQLDTLKVWAIE